MSRLRWKLLLAMLVVVLATLAMSGVMARRITSEQMKRLVVARAGPPTAAIEPVRQHVLAHGLAGIADVVARASKPDGQRLILSSPAGKVVALSPDLRDTEVKIERDGVTLARHEGNRVLRFRLVVDPFELRDVSGRTLALAYPLPPREERRSAEIREIAVLDQRLLIAFVGAAAVALLLTLFVSRRITHPIERLTEAVDAMAQGRLPTHVRVDGKDEIARLARSFNAMADSIRNQEELRKRMVADAAHEIRTPITNLRCELEAIQDGLRDPSSETIASLHDEVVHLGRIADDLQDLAVAEAGGLAIQKERIELVAVVSRAAEQYRSRNVAGPESAEPIEVDADPTRITQIVRNLVENALAHGTRVSLDVRTDGIDAFVSVADDGPGIPPAEIEKIFERFYRLDEARSRRAGGAGLGLAIVRRLVELHGGRVWAENHGGARFTFTLPLRGSA